MRQEPHRVYWQQWTTTPSSSEQQPSSLSRRDTTSAAVRISDAARAVDVTQLLRKNMTTDVDEPPPETTTNNGEDALVLVGSLYQEPIQFEHESKQQPQAQEQLHILKTLKPQDNPLHVRDVFLQKLKQRHQKHIPPRLQWFYVPASPKLPNFIELDGYCTTLEEEDVQDSDDDEEEREQQHEDDETDETHWWRRSTAPLHSTLDHDSHKRTRLHKEERRLNQLRNSYSAVDRHCVSGYLLERSHKDRHVWKRVHCILTDDYFWYVSRIHTDGARHGRISLQRALLLEPNNNNYTALSRIPHAFELVSKGGTSHVFRAPSRSLQQRWIQCLSDRIVQNHESKLLEHAELIVQDEAVARNKRLLTCAMEPLLATSAANENALLVRAVLRWGMEVAEYREACRHVVSRMPSRRPVVVVSSGDNPTPRRLFDAAAPNGGNHSDTPQQSDTVLCDMIKSTWETAAVLLRDVTLLIQQRVEGKRRKLETLCQHVDYVITGQFRSITSGEAVVVERDVTDPPPIDLFDALLTELQAMCSRSKEDKESNGHHHETMETPVLGK